jgi:hypothetical protein
MPTLQELVEASPAKKGKGIFVSNAIRKHKVMSINQYRYVLKVVSVFTLVPLKTH